MWREGKCCTTSRGDSSVQGIAGREGKNIPKNVRSKIFIKLFGFWKLFDNILSKVFGAQSTVPGADQFVFEIVLKSFFDRDLGLDCRSKRV